MELGSVSTAHPLAGSASTTMEASDSGHTATVETCCPSISTLASRVPDVVAPVTIVFDERMLLHVTAPMDDRSKVMPEQAVRILSIFHRLRSTGLLNKSDLRIVPSSFATDEDLLRVHTPELLARVRQCDKRADAEVDMPQGRMHLDAALARRFHLQPSRMTKWALELDDRDIFDWTIHPFQDTYAGPYTPSVAQLAAGGAIRAVDSVMRDGSVNAFAIIRPPGHHCQMHAAGGFCFYNNVAVAARYAQAVYGIKRVAIVDFDVHHGDGTQDVFKTDPSVLFISVHRYGNAFYPCTGDASEVGTGAGEGFSLNVPFGAAALGEVEYSVVFERIVLPVLAEFNPEMILVSAGFDAAEGDPLGGMKLRPSSYGYLTSLLAALDPPNGVVMVLEGGYNLTSIALDAEQCVRSLIWAARKSSRFCGPRTQAIAINAPQDRLPSFLHAAAYKTLQNVALYHAKFWKSLEGITPFLLPQCQGIAGDCASGWKPVLRFNVAQIACAIPVTKATHAAICEDVETAKNVVLDMDAIVLDNSRGYFDGLPPIAGLDSATEFDAAFTSRPKPRKLNKAATDTEIDTLAEDLAAVAIGRGRPSSPETVGSHLPFRPVSLRALVLDDLEDGQIVTKLRRGPQAASADAPSIRLVPHWCNVGTGELIVLEKVAATGNPERKVVIVDEAGRVLISHVFGWCNKPKRPVGGDPIPDLTFESDNAIGELHSGPLHMFQSPIKNYSRIFVAGTPQQHCEQAAARGSKFDALTTEEVSRPLYELAEGRQQAQVVQLQSRFNNTVLPAIGWAVEFGTATLAREADKQLKMSLLRDPKPVAPPANKASFSHAMVVSFDAAGVSQCDDGESSGAAGDGSAIIDAKPWASPCSTGLSVSRAKAFALVPDDLQSPPSCACKSYIAVLACTSTATPAQYACSGNFPLRKIEHFAASFTPPNPRSYWVRYLPASLPLYSMDVRSNVVYNLCSTVTERPVYVLAAQEDETPRQIASLTKIMTFITTMVITDAMTEAGKFLPPAADPDTVATPMGLDVEIIITKRSAEVNRGTVAGILEGETYTAWDLLYGMMLPSGNDAATALAEHFGQFCPPVVPEDWIVNAPAEHYEACWTIDDPVSKFVAEMNRIAQLLGMRSTTFSNPHGMVHERNVSTAADALKMTVAAFSDSRFRQVVGTTLCAVTVIDSPAVPAPAAPACENLPVPDISSEFMSPSAGEAIQSDTPANDTPTPSSAAVAGPVVRNPVLAPRRAVKSKVEVKTLHRPILPDARTHVTLFKNTNDLLAPKKVTGYKIDGIKTGITNAAGGCLATHALSIENSAIEPSSVDEIFCLTLGSASKISRFTDTRLLLDWCRAAASTIGSAAPGGSKHALK